MRNDKILDEDAMWFIPVGGEAGMPPRIYVSFKGGGAIQKGTFIEEPRVLAHLSLEVVRDLPKDEVPARIEVNMAAVRRWVGRRLEQ